MTPSFKYSNAYKALVKKYTEAQVAKIADALFLVYHPMSDFFELSITDKKNKAIEYILGEENIEWSDLQEAEDAYKQITVPRERSQYINASHLLDWAYESCSRIQEQRVGKLQHNITPALLKEVMVFVSKFSLLKEGLLKERNKAKQVVQQKTFGNLTLSKGDERFTKS